MTKATVCKIAAIPCSEDFSPNFRDHYTQNYWLIWMAEVGLFRKLYKMPQNSLTRFAVKKKIYLLNELIWKAEPDKHLKTETHLLIYYSKTQLF